MRKTELTEEQQVKFKWLMKADTVNEDVEVSKFWDLIWKSGTWKYGFWEGGIWKGGVWKDGYWEDGTWKSGIWKDGSWEDGTWESGFWEGGIWKGGVWKDGYMWSNLKQKYIYVKWSSHKKEFEEDLK